MSNRLSPSTGSMLMTLCPKCLSFYREHPDEYLIKRISPWDGPKSSCTKCNWFGYDYLVVEKERPLYGT